MIQPGDKVTRMLGGEVPMEMTVAAVDDRFIYCGAELTPGSELAFTGWKFDATYGYEVDEDLGWGVPDPNGEIYTGSFLVLPKEGNGQDRRD